MKLVKEKGGHTIAVYNKKCNINVKKLLEQQRVNFIATTNYKEDSNLDKYVKAIIDKIQTTSKVLSLEVSVNKKLKFSSKTTNKLEN